MGALLVSASEAGAAQSLKINVCNRGTIDAYAAVVWEMPFSFTEYTSEGWFQIRPSQCRDLAIGTTERHYIGVSITNAAGRQGMLLIGPSKPGGAIQATKREFCVHPTDPWKRRGTLAQLARCEGSFQLGQFAVSVVGAFNTHSTVTLNIDPTPQSPIQPFREPKSQAERQANAKVDRFNDLKQRLVTLIQSHSCIKLDGTGVRHGDVRILSNGELSFRSEQRRLSRTGRQVLTMADTQSRVPLAAIAKVEASGGGDCHAVELTCLSEKCIHVSGRLRPLEVPQSPLEQIAPQRISTTSIRVRTASAARQTESVLRDLIKYSTSASTPGRSPPGAATAERDEFPYALGRAVGNVVQKLEKGFDDLKAQPSDRLPQGVWQSKLPAPSLTGYKRESFVIEVVQHGKHLMRGHAFEYRGNALDAATRDRIARALALNLNGFKRSAVSNTSSGIDVRSWCRLAGDRGVDVVEFRADGQKFEVSAIRLVEALSESDRNRLKDC